MELFVELTAWANYATTQATLLAADEDSILAGMKFEEARAMLEGVPEDAKSRTPVSTIAKNHAETDDGVLEGRMNFRLIHAKRKLTEAVCDNIERSIFAVSRELTRRGKDEPNARRQQRWSA